MTPSPPPCSRTASNPLNRWNVGKKTASMRVKLESSAIKAGKSIGK